MKFLLFSGIFVLLQVHLARCTTVTLLAQVSMSKIKGTVTFTQDSPSSATHIDFNLSGVTEALKVQIHNLPMIYQGAANISCSSNAIGAVYDPSMSASSECSTTKKNKCAIGDISGKFGSIDQAKSKSNFSDPELPLDGKNSIYSRTLVFMAKGDVVKACALIDSPDHSATAMVRIKGPAVAGTVYFRQAKENQPTLFYSNLFFVNDSVKTKEFFLKIYTNRVSDEISKSQCSNLGKLYNPFGIANNGNCNKSNHAGCPVGDLLTKDGYVNVSQATVSLASTQVSYTDVNLPVIGAKSIIGHSLVLFHRGDPPTNPVACATILEVIPRKAKAEFTAEKTNGVYGSFVFEQASPFDPTNVDIKISNLRKKAEGYHVHEYPNPSYRNINDNEEACSLAVAGDHLNPYGVIAADSPANGAGTFDEYEIGDLSAKYGSFRNKDSQTSRHVDLNLPLFGRYSIIGRSVVIHNLKIENNNERWVCRNITLSMASTMRTQTKSHFTGPDIQGYVIMTQYNFTSQNAVPLETEIYLDLKHTKGEKTNNHNWHVHERKVGDDMKEATLSKRCQTPGPHYNPFKVNIEGNYKSTCKPDNPLRCELGDSSAKTAQYSLGSGPKFYTDIDTPLSGNYSVLGRSIVVHTKDGGAPRQGCADIVLHDDESIRKSHASHMTSIMSMILITVISLVVMI